MKLHYQDFQLPNYLNTAPAVTIPCYENGNPALPIHLSVLDIMLAAVFAGLNVLLISDTGRGKTQLVKDISNAFFGGYEEHGMSNFFKARANMVSIMNIFETIDVDTSSGRYHSDQARQLNMDRVSRLLHIVDELNLAPEVIQAEFFDLGEGEYAFKGRPVRLGRDDYSVCFATMNMNKNGDNGFSGTFGVNRALLNRTHLTLDLDTLRFRPTLADRDQLAMRGYSTVKTKNSKPRDLTSQIFYANQLVKAQTKEPSLEVRIFRQLVDAALSYCEFDAWKEKEGFFPMKCGECDKYPDKLCSLSKGCSERTLQGIVGLSSALAIIAEMKHGSPIVFDWFDLLLEAFKLTSYHGNLNSQVLSETYAGRRQLMMDKVVEMLRTSCSTIRTHIIEEHLEPKIIFFNLDSKKNIVPYDSTLETQLKKKRISLRISNLEDTIKSEGLGTDWIQIFRNIRGA